MIGRYVWWVGVPLRWLEVTPCRRPSIFFQGKFLLAFARQTSAGDFTGGTHPAGDTRPDWVTGTFGV